MTRGVTSAPYVSLTMRPGKNHDAPGIASADGFAPFRVHVPCLVEGGEAGKIRRETGRTRRKLAALYRECFNVIRDPHINLRQLCVNRRLNLTGPRIRLPILNRGSGEARM